jgi:AcrR family transcriptional regulator
MVAARAEGDQRRRMIAAMVARCAEQTYPRTTIADVVAAARVSRTTFYREFEDKRACFDAAVGYCIDELRAAAAEPLARDDEPGAKIRGAAAAILELLAERPELANLLVGDAAAVEPAVVDRYRELLLPAVRAIWTAAGVVGDTHMNPSLAFGRAQLLVFERVTAGRAEELPVLLPELVYLGVAPFAGHAAALAEARACGTAAEGARR